MMQTSKDEPPQRHVDTLTATMEQVKLVAWEVDPEDDSKRVEKVFYVNRDVVEISKHLKTALQSAFIEGKTREIRLSEMPARILEICIKYMHYKMIYQYLPHEQRPQFHIDPACALDVLNAAIYLQM